MRSQRARLRTGFWSRFTVSRLWLRMSGRASMTVRSRSSEPSKSGIRTSIPIPGLVSRIARIVSAKIREPPSGRSSRATLVTTTCSSPHRADRLRDPPRLVVVEPGRPAGLDRAEPAGPGARVAQDHDRGGPLVPALADVRAVGLLADRVEVQAAEQALEVVVVLARRHPGPDPVGVAAERRSSRRPPAARRCRRPSRSTAAPVRGVRRSPGGSNIGSSRAIGRSLVQRRSAAAGRTCRGGPSRRRGREAELRLAPCATTPSRSRRSTRETSSPRFGCADQARRAAP